MARTKSTPQSYSAGERGRNRVRVFPDPKTGMFQIEWREHGKRLSRSLGHRDWTKAKAQADEFAASYVEPEARPEPDPEAEPLTLGRLFEMYEEEVTPTKSERSRKHDRAAIQMFKDCLGSDRDPTTLSQREWSRFIKARSEGRAGMSGRPVGARTVERDLRLLMAVLNWATLTGDGQGSTLLDRNPLKGLRMPKEKNPRRVVLSDEEYQALLAVAESVDWRFRVALVLAHETGHRIGAIRNLRWSDVDFEEALIRWRAKHEKTGYEHATPLTSEARRALREALKHSPGIGGAPILPAPKAPGKPMSSHLARDWWERAEALASLEPKRGRGWHSLRRKFASDLMHQPLKVLCELGGWKTPRTVLECYQQPDQATMRAALQDRRRASGDRE